MDANRRGGIPKLREILRRQRGDSESSDAPDIEFTYDDTDSHSHELAELYSYTENTDFKLNRAAFEEHFNKNESAGSGWRSANESFQSNYLLNLLNDIERGEREVRLRLLRVILYLCQGCYGECSSIEEIYTCSRHNVFLLYESGFFINVVEMLNLESENGLAATTAQRKPAVSIADSTELRVILNILYCMVEEMRIENDEDSPHRKSQRAAFITELGMPILHNEPIAVLLFNMISKFCNGTAPHFPIKKVLLLLWKVILVSMGSLRRHFERKNEARVAAGLPVWDEDTVEICKTIRASSPPGVGIDLLENSRGRSRGAGTIKDAFSFADTEEDEEAAVNSDELTSDPVTPTNEDEPGIPRPGSPVGPPPIKPRRNLPWKPKVRVKDIEQFLDTTRQKFVGFTVQSDIESLAGLPQPIHEAVDVLKEHLYTSLAETQIKLEADITKHILSRTEPEIPDTAPEILYHTMLPNLPQYMISLLKLLLAAAPTGKAKADSINILADVLPDEMPTSVKESMCLGIDVNRHKEIIVKSISAIFLLLLKSFKLNHVYQFEFMSQHLVFANCIPLVIKFFNQNILTYVQANNTIDTLEYPQCLFYNQQEEEGDNSVLNDINLEESGGCCWRNLFSCINLLRILNKLTKWKHSRTMMLIIFKSAPILKRALKVKHAMMQVYVLKLIKLQTKYLGRQWRKSNMKTLSAIYSKVRHRLTDDWAFGNDLDARPWDFQQEEYTLRSAVDRFNNRRYVNEGYDSEYKPLDNNIQSVLGQEVPLTLQFKMNYDKWLEYEVFNRQTDWDVLLKC